MNFLKNLNILPRWIIIVLDGIILLSCAIFANFIRVNLELSKFSQENVLLSSLVFMLGGLLVMIFTKSYIGIVRHTGIRDGQNIVLTISINFILLAMVNLIAVHVFGEKFLMPTSVLIIASLLSLIGLVFYRLLVKQLFQTIKKDPRKEAKVIIFGAGEAGLLTSSVIEKDRQIKYKVVAFLDDDPKKSGKFIQGVKILYGTEALENLVLEKKVTDLIISAQDLSVKRRREIIDECLRLKINPRIVPPVHQWVNGDLNSKQIRDVKIEDLLSREPICLNNPLIKEELEGKVVLVTGAAGSIGSELCRQIVHYNPSKLLLLDQAESALYDIEQEIHALELNTPIEVLLADVRNEKRIGEIFKAFGPQVIFHAAAYKHVPMMEKYPEEAVKCNIIGTKIVADMAVFHKAEKFVLVSTDKAVNPTNVMGATKRAAEMYVQSLNQYLELTHKSGYPKFITTRFGNVLGSNGSVIPLFKKQIKKGGPITVTHPDITRYFMTIPEACELVLEAAVMGHGGEIYVFDMGEPVKIVDLAKKMIQLSGKMLDRDIKIVFTGLRDGEKLYEELLNDEEQVKVTHHPKIKIAKLSCGSYERVDTQILIFHDILRRNSETDLVRHIKTLVPEYISNSSRFEVLDRMN
ncbi:polysaccharide biosynthesis protein [Pararhodonellum marinum]|uniref:polysaccharide biosynthesis protein n=1 Tax=Pararhodonellum marinum TaxID=2755358 RepID=UPI00188F08FA|nr:nucleoside-diphosphate sugar epimerase/dehydratase [Pararhodonellum marinum]